MKKKIHTVLGERERYTDSSGRERMMHRERRVRGTQTQKEREREALIHSKRKREALRHRKRKRERHSDTERERERHSDTERERESEALRHSQRQKSRNFNFKNLQLPVNILILYVRIPFFRSVN